MGKIQQKFKQFKEWKQQPYRVAPIPEEEHVCPTCETHYYGHYCPRCGQSCKIARYSFKNALMLYLDVWGLGNRGMFHTIHRIRCVVGGHTLFGVVYNLSLYNSFRLFPVFLLSLHSK